MMLLNITGRVKQCLVSLLIFMSLTTWLVSACHPANDPENQNRSAEKLPAGNKANRQTSDTLAVTPVFPGGDAIQLNCEFIQDQAEVLLEEYHQPATPANRLTQIVAELKKLNQKWIEGDCQQVFGFMVPDMPAAPSQGK
jgi:hypothetical protein